MRADKLRNKEKIISKASLFITGNNIDHISLEEIATAAEVTRATIYNHFSSKEDLLKEMLLPALTFATEDLKERNIKSEIGFNDITTSLFNLYRKYKETIELASCHTLYNNSEVADAHGRFMEQFKRIMISAAPGGYPLGLELSMRIISRIYLPVLREIHNGYEFTEENEKKMNSLFTRIIQGALCI